MFLDFHVSFRTGPKMTNNKFDMSNKNMNSVRELVKQQYKHSLQSCSNITSNILLNDVWSTHMESFERDQDSILSALKASLNDKDTNNLNLWKCSLSQLPDPLTIFEKLLHQCENCMNAVEFEGTDLLNSSTDPERARLLSVTRRESGQLPDPITIFEKSLHQCENCMNAVEYEGFEQFRQNNCKCDLSIIETEKYPTKKIIKKNQPSEPCEVIYLNSDSSSQDSKSGEELSNLLKPRFDRSRNASKILQPKKKPAQEIDFEKVEEENKSHQSNVAKITFKTAKESLLATNPAAKRILGASRKAQGKFVSPMIGAQDKQDKNEPVITDERLKHLDPKMIELIESEIIDRATPIGWDDIAGLHMAKSVIQEAVVLPLLRPDIFTGLRRPPKGILLFGPPGTGKTLIGKCIASQCHATFFSISASSLTSKWIGDGEKMVRALFAVARCHQPAVIFIDEIDSLLTQRSDSEHEATRRIKTEFLVQLDGAATAEEDRLLIVGATNRPQELDEAARRRLVKRLYIPLPDAEARNQIIANLLKTENNDLTTGQIEEIASLTDGYSGADMKSLCSEAAMGPIRSVPLLQIVSIDKDKVRPVNVADFMNALQRVRPSVSQDDLGQYVKWNKTYGQGF